MLVKFKLNTLYYIIIQGILNLVYIIRFVFLSIFFYGCIVSVSFMAALNDDVKLYKFDIEGSDETIKECIDIMNYYTNKFNDENLSEMTNEEIITSLFERYKHAHTQLMEQSGKLKKIKKSSLKQEDLSKYNCLIKILEMVRGQAELLGLEDELSIKITETDRSPFYKVLRDNNKHKYQYEDELKKAYVLFKKTKWSKEEYGRAIEPRNWMNRKEIRKSFEPLLKKSCKNTKKYIEYMKSTFSEKFCIAYEKVNGVV